MKKILALLLLTNSFGSAAAQHNESIPVVDVTIADLISNSDFYNNVIVRVRGAAVLRFEAEFICQSVSDIDSETGRCLRLQAVAKNGRLGSLNPTLYHNKIVLLTGVFDKDYAARTSLPGSIAPIRVVVIGKHNKGDIPPPPPEPSANNSFKPTPLRGAA
jgi:hypothetical protein